MPNGYSGGCKLERADLLDVLRAVPGNSVVGMGLSVVTGMRLGDVSASEIIRWLEGCKQDVLGVEEEYNAEYTVFFLVEAAAVRQAEVLGLVIRPTSSIYNAFRAKLKQENRRE